MLYDLRLVLRHKHGVELLVQQLQINFAAEQARHFIYFNYLAAPKLFHHHSLEFTIGYASI